ncbi:hypothetical protein NMY22_g17922 [Coprinellus aureogranulatus]|nr:hypothetical protein NMY22_g17922 [Coprinellus aureogranulatus]
MGRRVVKTFSLLVEVEGIVRIISGSLTLTSKSVVIARVASGSSRQTSLNAIRRRLATEATASGQPVKKKNVLRRLILLTSAATGTFYVGSTFVAFNSQAYYDFFGDNIPGGRPMLEYAELHKWDQLTVEDIVEAAKNGVIKVQKVSSDLLDKTPGAREALEKAKTSAFGQKAEEVKESTVKAVKESKEKVFDPVVKQVKKEVKEDAKVVKDAVKKVEEKAKETEKKVEEELSVLIKKAEAAISGTAVNSSVPTEITVEGDGTPVVVVLLEEDKNVYDAPLPLGFEPPPGYVRPTPPKPAKTEEAPKVEAAEATRAPEPEVVLPLVAPAISSLNVQEPIITHLAGTIDNLASFLKSNPSAATQATDVLEGAKGDLAALVERMEKVKEEERAALAAKLDEQTAESNLRLLELEMAAQDKLDSQEEGFRKFFEQERQKFLEHYRAKLENELKTQTELINERCVAFYSTCT